MIFQRVENGFLLITQPDHAALARAVMGHWRRDGLPDHPRRASILRAIERHDDGWLAIDVAPTIDDAGRVLDFMHMPADVTQAMWPRAVGLLEDDPWAAALVAEHALQIHAHSRERPEWTAFFRGMERRRDDALARSDLASVDVLRADYAFLRVADLISLVFCNRWLEGRETHGYRIEMAHHEVVVSPDPFAGARVPLAVEARRLPRRRYVDAAEAADAWQQAERVTLRGTARGATDITAL